MYFEPSGSMPCEKGLDELLKDFPPLKCDILDCYCNVYEDKLILGSRFIEWFRTTLLLPSSEKEIKYQQWKVCLNWHYSFHI